MQVDDLDGIAVGILEICVAADESDMSLVLIADDLDAFGFQLRYRPVESLTVHDEGVMDEGMAGIIRPPVVAYIGQDEEVIADDKTFQGMTFNHDEMHIVCPWHGWEYDIATGEMVADRNFRLRKYEVDIRGDEVYVLT